MKDMKQEYQRNLDTKGNLSALIGSKVNATNGKRKDSAQEGNACSSRRDEKQSLKSNAPVLSCFKTADSKRVENYSKGKAFRGRSPP